MKAKLTETMENRIRTTAEAIIASDLDMREAYHLKVHTCPANVGLLDWSMAVELMIAHMLGVKI